VRMQLPKMEELMDQPCMIDDIVKLGTFVFPDFVSIAGK